MSSLSDVFTGLTAGLDLGTRGQRDAIREAVDATCARQGYQATIASFKDGVLILHARPAEAYLLRMDLGAVVDALADAGVGDAVRDVKVFCRI